MLLLNIGMDLYENGSKAQREEFVNGSYSRTIYSLSQCVLEESRDAALRCRAVKLLSEYYVKSGNDSKALMLIHEVADWKHCREHLLEYAYSGKEKLRQLQENMLASIDYAATSMVKIAFQKEYGFTNQLTVDEKICYIQTANQLYELLMPDGNFQFYHRTVGWNHRRLAELYLLKKETALAVKHLLLAEQHANKYDAPDDFCYTSCFLNLLEHQPADDSKCWSGSERGMLLYRIREMPKEFQMQKEVHM